MKKKILILQFKHETNSFCPVKADEKAYRNILFKTGEEMFTTQRGIRNEIGGFLDVFDNYDEFELIPTVALNACPSGPVTADVYDFVLKEVADCIQNQDKLDGILISFHGAMVSEKHDDGEGDLLQFIRGLVGWKIPIMATLDLHANVTDKMANCATALFPYEKYPHIDTYETAYKAASVMADTLKGKIKPVMVYRKIPFLLPLLPDSSYQLQPIYDLAEKLKADTDSVTVRFTHGFFPSDIEEMGMSVLAITNDNKELAEKYADTLYNFIIKSIPTLTVTHLSLDEVFDKLDEDNDKPIVLADSSDNPGAGALGDTTHVLRQAIKRGIRGIAIATITDPESVERCIQAGVGATVELELGGKSDVSYSGGPLKVTAYVKKLSDGKYMSKAQMSYGAVFDHGKTAVVEIEGNIVIITTILRQPYDVEILYSQGINPMDMKMIVVKSSIHYRASYGSVASEMIPVALPGYSVPVPQAYNYKKWKGEVNG